MRRACANNDPRENLFFFQKDLEKQSWARTTIQEIRDQETV